MSMIAEQLKTHWKSTPARGCFDKDAVNWTDLSITADLNPILTPILATEGFSPAKLENLPTILLYGPRDQRKHYGVKTVEELPDYVKNTGVLMTIETIVENNLTRGDKPLYDPSEKLYFIKPGATPHTATAIAIHNREFAISEYWKVQWGLQLDTLVGIDEDLTEEMAAALVPPQSVRRELADRQNRISIINGESFADSCEAHQSWFPPILVDGYLIYNQLVSFNRKGEYPLTDSRKPEVVLAISEVIGRIVAYDEVYRNNLLQVYKIAIARGVNIKAVFAAKEI